MADDPKKPVLPLRGRVDVAEFTDEEMEAMPKVKLVPLEDEGQEGGRMLSRWFCRHGWHRDWRRGTVYAGPVACGWSPCKRCGQ